MTLTVDQPHPEVGPLLRTWRHERRYSQLELSLRSEVSTRHLSRVETGRAHPTPEMIMRLSDHLEIPITERNRLLLAAGFAPHYSDHAVDDMPVAVVMDGLRALVDAHLPYPALLLDSYWDVVDANSAVDPLLAGAAPALLEPPINVLRLTLHPQGLADRINNLPGWAAHLQSQLRHRAERTADPRHRALAEEITAYVPHATNAPAPGAPVLTLDLDDGDGGLLRFFTMSARLDTATDATLEGLHLETFLPADEDTRRRLQPIPT